MSGGPYALAVVDDAGEAEIREVSESTFNLVSTLERDPALIPLALMLLDHMEGARVLAERL